MEATNIFRLFTDGDQFKNVNRALVPGKIVKQLAKFFVALFFYLSANIILSLLFNGVHINCYIVFEAVAQGLRMFVAQGLGMVCSLVTNSAFYALITLAGIVGFGFVFVARIVESCGHGAHVANDRRCDNVKTGRRASISNYKYHIQFLS